MENHEFADGEHQANDEIPHSVAYLELRRRIGKASERIMREERKHMDDDEMREIEVGQTFPLFNFLR